MRTALVAALAALGLAGCSLTIDPDGVEPPKDKKVTSIGACVDAANGHSVCGGRLSGGALPVCWSTPSCTRTMPAASRSSRSC